MNSINLANNKNEETIKHSFKTREGTYRKLNFSEYTHILSKNYNGTTPQQTNIGIKCSFCYIQDSSTELICFNACREIYVYNFYGANKMPEVPEVNLPVDKRIYKGTFPTCHDFNKFTATSESVQLLVGFSTGQIQLYDPFRKEMSKFFNAERLIDTEKVTCIKWLPNSENQFLVSHSSGQLYLYKEDLACDAKSPNYQSFKSGDGYSIYTCKTKSTQNPLFRWVIGDGALNEFAFSPCGKYLATVSQDGFLRVFDHNTMELVGRLRSYFGGLLCVCWSPDSRLIATGGEDDLVTVWSFVEKRVIAKGRGHKSWVSVVAFDSFTTCLDGINKLKDAMSNDDDDESLDEQDQTNKDNNDKKSTQASKNKDNKLKTTKNRDQTDDKACSTCVNNCSISCPNSSTQNGFLNTYRLASVGQDTQLCFWEISDDILKQSIVKSRTSILSPSLSNHQSPTIPDATTTTTTANSSTLSNTTNQQPDSANTNSDNKQSTSKEKAQAQAGNLKAGFLNLNLTNGLNSTTSSNSSNLSSNKSTINASFHKSDHSKKEHKRNFSLNTKHHSDKNQNKQQSKTVEDPVKLLGTPICPRLEDVVKLEPLVCKKISHERLSSLTFCEDCFVVACHDVSTWSRPTNQSPSVLYDMIDELAHENGSTVV